jgi:hypothetical protein
MKHAPDDHQVCCQENGRLREGSPGLLIGYMRVSKSDGSQVLDLQRDSLLAAGVAENQLYSDMASARTMIDQA